MPNRKVIFWSACAGILMFGASVLTLGAILPELRDKLGLDDQAAGTIFSVLPFGMLTGALFFGPVADRYGFKILLAASCFILFGGFMGIAFSATKTLIPVFAFVSGCGGGAINGATSALVSDISTDDKGAKLSLLGFFFGIGALGMPLLLGLLKPWLGFEAILLILGGFSFVIGLLYLGISFPEAKQPFGFPLSKGLALLKDQVLLLIAFFLFLQSSFEGLLNNWTTTYALGELSVNQSQALFVLSAYAGGMTLMRLLIGSIFARVAPPRLLYASLGLIFAGLILVKTDLGFIFALTGFVLTGAGLAAGFPVMLGFVGNRHPSLSGTAFSIAFSIALTGNMLINYSMGLIAGSYGIRHLLTFTFAELVLMIFLSTLIIRKINQRN